MDWGCEFGVLGWVGAREDGVSWWYYLGVHQCRYGEERVLRTQGLAYICACEKGRGKIAEAAHSVIPLEKNAAGLEVFRLPS